MSTSARVGDIVLFSLSHGNAPGALRPAIVTAVDEKTGALTVSVFSAPGDDLFPVQSYAGVQPGDETRLEVGTWGPLAGKKSVEQSLPLGTQAAATSAPHPFLEPARTFETGEAPGVPQFVPTPQGYSGPAPHADAQGYVNPNPSVSHPEG